ncbi:hypothetical protein F4801DRAFT_542180 [Xylaria longipes]|nr:hypothetical protein F4801DRAFT_542180 [Xylaria longipes]
MAVRGLLTGGAYAELEGVCYVVSSSGYISTVAFAGKIRKAEEQVGAEWPAGRVLPSRAGEPRVCASGASYT